MNKLLLVLICGLLAIFRVSSAETGKSFLDRFDMDFYGWSLLSSTDSIKAAQWGNTTFGVEAWANGRESLNVLSVTAEGRLAYGKDAEDFWTQRFVQQDWRFSRDLGISLSFGQRLNLAKENFARAYKNVLPRQMDVELPFTEHLSGGAVSAYWDRQDENRIPLGFKMSWSFGKPRPMPEELSDTLFSAFPVPQWELGAAYHIAGYVGKTRLDLGWEKEVGHNVSLYSSPHKSLNLGLSWTYSFHPNYEAAPDNLYGAKLNWNFWRSQSKKHSFSIASGLDFGDQDEAIQAFVGYKQRLSMNGQAELKVGYDSLYEEPVVALSYYWLPRPDW